MLNYHSIEVPPLTAVQRCIVCDRTVAFDIVTVICDYFTDYSVRYLEKVCPFFIVSCCHWRSHSECPRQKLFFACYTLSGVVLRFGY